MPTVLITGANRGLGFEFAKQYAADGWRVIAACRVLSEAEALNAVEGDIRIETMDVDDDSSVATLSEKLQGEAIDLLINNAGIHGPRKLTAQTMDYEAWEQVLRTNTMSPFRVTAAFLPHVLKSGDKLIATVSSRLGSMGDNKGGGDYIYRSSKAGLNAVMKGLSIDLADDGIRMVLLHPGWVSTDMGGPNAPVKADESVTGMRRVIAGIKEDETGVFYNYDGSALGW
ncbi:MAG TPA: SDR family oxidoreductase [Rhodospirillales bacterium]|jgi:NAD(P)-dependent dehydrogenase (short-subunit alcohol dehydrogenase family)|nr:SDR family oxidoreductase [Rhodospirillales bacterium]